jgi:3-deoxy-D-manno-octulosonic-acid transferase
MWALRLYQLMAFLAGPFLFFSLRRRAASGRENAGRLGERRGIAAIPRPDGQLVWLHAASVGETNSILPLVEDIFAANPKLNILLTTGTVTSAERVFQAQSQTTPRLLHQFMPLDRRAWVERFLAHWRPDLAGWVESEIWPNMVLACAAQNLPLTMINGRLSDRSYRRWQRIPKVAQKLLSCFHLLIAQDQTTADRLSALGAKNPVVCGNLKLDAPALTANAEQVTAMQAAFGARPVWLAASTHAGEEIAVLETHKLLLPSFPNLLTLIAPRHAVRGGDIYAELAPHFPEPLAISQRSQNQALGAQTQVYLVDTMGELGLLYSSLDLVFIGGTLVAHGGQNPIEAAALNCALLHGPNVQNFAEIFADLQAHKAAIKVSDAAELAAQIHTLMDDPNTANKLANQAAIYVDSQRGARQKVYDLLHNQWSQTAPKGRA